MKPDTYAKRVAKAAKNLSTAIEFPDARIDVWRAALELARVASLGTATTDGSEIYLSVPCDAKRTYPHHAVQIDSDSVSLYYDDEARFGCDPGAICWGCAREEESPIAAFDILPDEEE